MKFFYTLLVLFFISTIASGQAPTPNGFGGFTDLTPDIRDEITPEQRQAIQEEVKSNIRQLAKKGITAQSQLLRNPKATLFGWPLRKAAGFTDPSYYGISNYVDVDPTSGVKDYNCGSRSYNGHMGTDIFTVPFWWKKMDENSVEIVAAADGIIVAKAGTREDKSCAMCPAGAPESCFYWNAVYLQHADGTLTMYGHMKKNSPTSKSIGDAVTKGEYLGVVGSSGNSTGPHLHFEVWQDTFFNKLLHPWSGPCNPDGNASMWETQQPYYQPEIIKIMTGSAIPEIKACYNGAPENTFEKNDFTIGDTIYLPTFVRDHRGTGPSYNITLTGPGTINYQWTLPANTWAGHYAWLYFYYSFDKTTFGTPGTWKYSVQFGTSYAETTFTLKDPLPLDLISFTARSQEDQVVLNWETTSEINTSHFEIQHSTDGELFTSIGTVATVGNGNSGNNSYSFIDRNASAGNNFYRLKMVDKDGVSKMSKIEKVNLVKFHNVKVYPNPATNSVSVRGLREYNKLRIANLQGQQMISKSFENTDEIKLDISGLPSGVYILQVGKNNYEHHIKLIKK